MPQNEIPESVMQEWKKEFDKQFPTSFLSEREFYIKGCKSQYPFREKYDKLQENFNDLANGAELRATEIKMLQEKNKVLRDALETLWDAIQYAETEMNANYVIEKQDKDLIQQALKQTEL